MRRTLLWLLLAIFLTAGLLIGLVPRGGAAAVIGRIGAVFAATVSVYLLIQLWDYVRPARPEKSAHRDAPSILYGDKGELPADFDNRIRKRFEEDRKRGLVQSDWKPLERRLQRLAFYMIADDQKAAAPKRWVQRQIGWRALQDGMQLGLLIEDGGGVRFDHPSVRGHFALPGQKQAIQRHWYGRWSPEQLKRFMDALADMRAAATPAVPALIEAMDDDDADIARWAKAALVRIGAPAIPALIQVMNGVDEYDTMPWLAAGVLTKIGAPAVPALADALMEPYDIARQSAAHALGNLGAAAAPAVPALIEALVDPSDMVRRSVVQALGNMGAGAASAVPALMDILKNQEDDLRLWVAGALRRIGVSPASVSTLVGILKNGDESLRALAVVMLERIGAPAAPALVDTLKDQDESVRAHAISILTQMGAPAVPALTNLFLNEKNEARWLAARILGSIGTAAAPAVPALIVAAKEADPMVRVRVELALAGIGTPEAREALRRFAEQDGGKWRV